MNHLAKMRSQNRRWPLLLLGFLWLTFQAGCDPASAPKTKGGGTKEKAEHLVEVIQIRTRPLSHTTKRTGSLTALGRVKVFNQEEGRIDLLRVFEGDTVAKGEVLVQLDDKLLKTELEKAIAGRQQAQSDLERAVVLVGQKIAPNERLVEAKTKLRIARAEESLFQTRVGYTKIHAPFDAVVTQRFVDPGDVAPRHTHLLTLIDADSLFTKVAVSELLLPHLKVGHSAEVRIDALGDVTFPGKIVRIHPTVDPRTRQGVVEVKLTQVPPAAAAGQLCRVTLQTPAVARRVVPFAALLRDRESTQVFALEKGQAIKRQVRTGLRFGDEVEVLEGVVDGDLVVIRGFLGLTEGRAVKVVGKPSPPTGPAEKQPPTNTKKTGKNGND